MNNRDFQRYARRVDELVERVSALSDLEARTAALELLQSIMDLHGVVISQMVELLSREGDAGRSLLTKLAEDPLVCGLLVLYGIHPKSAEERVRAAIEKLRPQLEKQGASPEFLDIHDGTVRIRLHSKARGFSVDKLQKVIEQSILEAAPEAIAVITEGLTAAGFVPVNMIQPATKEETSYEESAA